MIVSEIKGLMMKLGERKQVRIHDRISRERWAGALMEVRSLFGLNSKTRDQRTDGPTDRRTDKASYKNAPNKNILKTTGFSS